MTHTDAQTEDRELAALMADYRDASVPTPDGDFYDRAIARAVQEGHKRQRSRWVMTGFGGAVASLSAVGFFGGEPGKRMFATCIFAACSALLSPAT